MDIVRPFFEHRFFDKSPAFVSIDGTLKVDITDLDPGQMYRFGVRAAEYNKDEVNFASLPNTFGGLKVYPESPLRQNITKTSSIIPLLSVEGFPSNGTVKIGSEQIQYSSVDAANNNLLLTNITLQRGFNSTEIAFHNIDGYDGYETWVNSVLFWPIVDEEQNTVVFTTQNRFDVNNYAFTLADGYRQTIKDIVNTDLSASDAANKDFPAYDYSGWNRIDPVALLNGECVGSYFGGALYCADGYDGVGRMLRGISVNDVNTQRQELLLSATGEPVVLVKRMTTGIRCRCILPTTEMPDARCLKCFGSGFIVGYSQHFSARDADGRIKVRFDPLLDSLPVTDAGLEVQEVKPNAWTLVTPAIKPRDFLVRFDEDGNEEFRYEILQVTRNVLFGQSMGGQKLALQRIRKTDIIYQCKVFRNTASMPSILTTGISSVLGIAPHSHTIVRNEGHPSTWNQISSVSHGHSHVLSWNPVSGTLQISQELSHSHTLVI